jgi:hypothetical protein
MGTQQFDGDILCPLIRPKEQFVGPDNLADRFEATRGNSLHRHVCPPSIPLFFFSQFSQRTRFISAPKHVTLIKGS